MASLDPPVERPLAPGDQSAAALGDDLAPAELGAWRGLLRVHAALVKAARRRAARRRTICRCAPTRC